MTSHFWPYIKSTILLPLLVVASSGCAYRFTNTAINRPEGIRTIAVEAIYDTSREVLAHELLWESLQAAFARDGNLILTDLDSADAVVRAHIKQAAIVPVGAETPNSDKDEPKLFDGESPPAPKDFSLLTQAGEFRQTSSLRLQVQLEVWHRGTRKMLMQRNYVLSRTFRAVHAGSGNVTTKTNDYLRYEEAVDTTFKVLADNIAARAVKDLLVR